MRQTLFVTTTITSYTYKITAFNKVENSLVTVDYVSKTKGDSDSLVKAYNKANKHGDNIAVKADFVHYDETRYKLELNKFIELAQPVDKRTNGDYICRNINTYSYKITAFNKVENSLVTVDYVSKTKGDSDSLVKAYNKANKDGDNIAVKAELVQELNQMYCISISDFIANGEKIDEK